MILENLRILKQAFGTPIINKNNFDALQWSLAEQHIGEGSPNMKVVGVAVGNFHAEP